MAGLADVRVEESLRIKIGEAKNLPTHIYSSGGGRNTLCIVKLDNEEIFRTQIVDKSLNPFYGEEFHGEIPKRFRYLSCYVVDTGYKAEKVIGKVSLRKEELHKYHGKDHWFPLSRVGSSTEVQGKVHVEIRFDEYLNTEPESFSSHRMVVRVIECLDLTVVNGACNPYAVITVTFGKSRHREEVKRTSVKKKTICPQFEETFFFDLDKRNQNGDKNQYIFEDFLSGDLCISLWHDDTKVSREMLGGMFPGAFLGEVKIPLRDLDPKSVHKAWYFLHGRENGKQPRQDLGSLRLRISCTSDYVFSSDYYDELRNLLLKSAECTPITSSAAYILGEIVENPQNAAQPLMKIFLHYGKLVPLIKALAENELSKTSDPNTIFRGNTLVTKVIDELMKLVGLPYLQDTIKSIIDEICTDHHSCEIDPSKLKDAENVNTNMEHLKVYVEKMFKAITRSGFVCPQVMCEVFYTLREAARKHFPDNREVRYQVVSGFVFLRFFAPAILGPKLFDLRTSTQDAITNRALTLISKAIQGLGNLVSSRTHSFGLKEDYMVPLFQSLSDDQHVDQVKKFLDVISSGSRVSVQDIEAPTILKEGMMIKRAQGRGMFGLKNFKRRYLCLTNQSLFYSREKGDEILCQIPIHNIWAVEKLQEESFKMKYMFQVVQPERALYIQANNCVEEKEWLELLKQVCNSNKNRLKKYHPAAYIGSHWQCCKNTDCNAEGCKPVSGGIQVAEIQVDKIDADREVEKIHSLYLTYMDKLETMQDACASQEVYTGDSDLPPSMHIEDTKSCFVTLNNILSCVIKLEQEHLQYKKMLQKQRVIGSCDTPFGDETYSDLHSPSSPRL